MNVILESLLIVGRDLHLFLNETYDNASKDEL